MLSITITQLRFKLKYVISPPPTAKTNIVFKKGFRIRPHQSTVQLIEQTNSPAQLAPLVESVFFVYD